MNEKWWLLGPMMEEDTGASGGADEGGDETGGEGGPESGEEGGAEVDTGGEGSEVNFTPEQKAVIGRMVSGRVNEVKKQYEGTAVYKETVEMIGDIIGSKDINVISQHLKGLHAQHQAKQMGMTPQGYQQYQSQTQQTAQQLRDTKVALAKNDLEKLKADPKYVDLEMYGDDIVEMSVNSGLSVQQAYWAIAGESASRKLSESAASDAEHRVLNNITNNRTKQVEGGDSGGQKGSPQITAEIKAMAAKVGMDPAEYMKYQDITSLDQARAARPKE